MNTIIVNKKIKSDLINASKIIGLSESDIFERALSYYLNALKSKMDLKKEFEAWDKLSDEAMLKMKF